MRVWERGVGVTSACGTGACACAVAAVRRGLTDRKVDVVLDGGTLTIETANMSLSDREAARYEDMAPGEYVTLSVSDTGSGILKADLAACRT